LRATTARIFGSTKFVSQLMAGLKRADVLSSSLAFTPRLFPAGQKNPGKKSQRLQIS
jgi:hypothetical protein